MRATCFSLCFPGVAGQRLRKLLTPMVVVEQGGRTGRRLLVCGCAGSSVLALDLTGLAVEGELWGERELTVGVLGERELQLLCRALSG